MNIKSLFITSVAISILFSGVSAVAGKTIYVDDSATGANNGSSWLNAYSYLQDALTAASAGDQILVAQGTYRPDRGQGITPGDRSSSFQPANGLTIKGGYAGCNAPDPDVRDIRSYETILSGDLDGNDVEVADPTELLSEPTRAENSCNVIVASGCDRTTLLEGLTITGGNGNGAMLSGAGIYNGKPTVSLCKIVANSAVSSGGGIYFEHAAHSQGALLKDSTISHNSANSGGGVYGCAEVVNCTFTDNAAVDGYAGALNLGSDCETTVTDCIFSRNYAAQSAGAVYLDASGTEVTFTRCTFVANSSGDKGGAIYADGCTCGSYSTFYQCRFIGNSAAGDGGAICDYGFTDMQLYSCLLVGNSAGKNGGALCDEYDGGSALINCTVSNNAAAGQGGGVCYDNYSYKGRRLANTIIWANSDKNGRTDPYSQIYLIEVSELQDVTHCCIQVIPPEIKGQGNTTSDPLFVDADGPDNVPGNEDDNLHLLGDSPCVDTGHNEYVPQQSSDLDGNPRIINGAVDRGAYEDGRQEPGIIHVDDSATGINNGTSWKDAFKYLQVGILTASSGNEIRVAQGIYKPNEGVVWDTPDDRLITFQLKNGVTIKGGYAGFGQPDPDNRNIEVYKTILSGDIRGNDVDVSDPCFLPSEPSRMDNNYHVVTGSGTNETAVLDGFTITGGHARESGGGGMCNINGSPTVKGCTFLKNSAYAFESGAKGGGIYNEYGSPTLVECKFIMNAVDVAIPDHGSGNGGAIADTHSSPKIINCTFIRNVALGNDGGAVYHSGGSAEITDCTFEHNAARRYGGGMGNRSGDSRVTDCTFVRNSSAGGGGLYNSFSSSSITGCKFTENVGSGFGGGVLSDSGGTFSGCTFSSNFSGVRGGGMYVDRGNPTVTSCIFVGNISGDGAGGLYIEEQSSVTVTDCVFSENTIYDGQGAGIWNYGKATVTGCKFVKNSGSGMYNEGESTLTNCIFTGNSSEYGAGMLNASGLNTSSTATLINCLLNENLATVWGGGLCSVGSTVLLVNCTFAANSSPLGSGLACRSPINVPDSNVTITNCILWDQNGEIWVDDDSTVAITYSDIQGGWYTGEGNVDTDPLFMNQAGGNYHLRGSSPCVNAGNNSAVSPSIITDLDGRPRIVNGKVDMGAYEYYEYEPPALVAHWKLDESEGDTAKDSAGTNDGILHGPQWQPYNGRLEGALLFDGENDYVDCGNSPTFDITGQISVGAWVNINSVNMEWQTVIAKGDSAWRLSTARDEYRYCFAVTGGPPWNYISGETVVAANEWHHVCGTYDGANLRLYIDGVEDPAGPVPELNGVATDDYDVYIGENQERPGRYWDGLIDDVRVYNYALTPAQVFNLCRSGILYVDSDARGANNGSGWADAFKCLQDALAAANDGTEIRVAHGSYKPDCGAGITPGDRQAAFQLVNGVTIKGGYAGFGQPQPNARDINLYETILSGDLAGNDGPDQTNRSDNSRHVVTGSGTDDTAIVDGVTITGGYADGIDSDYPFINNGAGMYNENGSPTLIDCTFTQNIVVLYDYEYGGLGAAIYNLHSHPVIKNCTFRKNSTGGGHGVVHNESSSPTISDCTFQDNEGGGIEFQYETRATVIRCSFIGNVSGYGSGINCEYGSSPAIGDCVFIGNTAWYDGGALRCYGDCSPVVRNCIFVANRTTIQNGGAISTLESSPTLTNCTFTANNAASKGGAIFCYEDSHPKVTNCILWGNSAADGAQIALTYHQSPGHDPSTTEITVSYSNVQGGPEDVSLQERCSLNCGLGNIDADPLFVRSGYWDNDLWIDGDYHLRSAGWRWDAVREEWTFDRVTSPCLDAGNPGSPLGAELLCVPEDPNNEWGENLRINMGAYGGTAQASIPPYDWALLADVTNDGIVDWLDFACAGSDWLKTAPQQPCDLNRNGAVNPADLDPFADDWLKTTIWRK